MPGMESQLHAVMNVPGDYEGFSSQLQRRRLLRHALPASTASPRPTSTSGSPRRASTAQPVLGRARVPRARPAERERPAHRASSDVDPDLFRRIVNRCVEEGRLCIDQMAALDARGGTGLAGTLNTIPAAGRQASVLGPAPFYVAEFCTPAESVAQYGQDTVVLLAPPPAPAAAPRRNPLTAEDADGHRNPRLRRRRDQLPLRPADLGGAAAARADPGRHLHRRRARRPRAPRRAHLLPPLGLPLARVVHLRRPQEDRHHVHGPRPRSCCCAASPTRS